MRLDFFDLALLLNIVETGSMTQGAARSAISLQAASERIKKLEQSFKVPLFTRHAAGVKLTAAGQTFQLHAQQLIQQFQQLQQDMQPFVTEQHTQIKLWCNSSAQSEYLPQLLPQYLKQNPHHQIEFKEAESSDIIAALLAGQAQLGIVTNFFDAKHLQTEALWEDRLTLICPKGHPLHQQSSLALLECMNYPFVGLMQYHSLQQSIEAQAKLLGYDIQYRLRLPSFAVIAQVVADGVAIAIMPKRAADRLAQDYAFAQVPLHGAWANRKLQLAAQDFKQLPEHYQNFVQYLRSNTHLFSNHA